MRCGSGKGGKDEDEQEENFIASIHEIDREIYFLLMNSRMTFIYLGGLREISQRKHGNISNLT